MTTITSIKDPLVIQARELQTKTERFKQHKCLLFDKEQIDWALQAKVPIDGIMHVPGAQIDDFRSVPRYQTTDGILKKATDTNYLVPMVAIGNVEHLFKAQEAMPLVMMLDHLQDYGNIGTIIRTANAFNMKNFIISGETDVLHRKVTDAARGLNLQSTYRLFENGMTAVDALKKEGYQIVATSPHANILQSQVQLEHKPTALLVGNESHGLSDEIMSRADFIIQIPMHPAVESLNVGVAAGISLYELKFKMVLIMLKQLIFKDLGRQVNVAGKLIQMVFDKKIRQITGLSGMQVILLMIMKCDEAMSLEQISQDTATFGLELDTLLKPLYTQKLISKQDIGILLTEQGEKFLAEIWPITEQLDEEILKDFSETERTQFTKLLNKLIQRCEMILK